MPATQEYIKKMMAMNSTSSMAIKQGDLKNRFTRPYLPTMIIDNFYDEPDIIRDYALDLEFFKGDRGTWPGLRTELLHKVDIDLFNLTVNKIKLAVKDYGYTNFLEVQTGFQIIEESWGEGWVHDDDPKLNIAGLIYLNPYAPLKSGTYLYEDNDDYDGEKYVEPFMNDVLVSSAEERQRIADLRKEQVSCFKETVIAENVYNRCIIFDPRNWHRAGEFFGKEHKDSRLTQVFFIRAE